MSNVLTQAFNQWCKRPADERFTSLEDMHQAVKHYRDIAREWVGSIKSLVVEARDGRPQLVNPLTGNSAEFTHWSFGQVARLVSAPAEYLRNLPAGLAATNLRHGLETLNLDPSDKHSLLFGMNGTNVIRAITTDSYKRIWNHDVTSRLLRLTAMRPEWQPAPAAFDGSRGLYASDHDMFAFLVDNDRRIFEQDPNGGLGRGFFVWNSEVGASSFGVMTFYYEYCCGNHRVWGASGVTELKVRHIGQADDRAFSGLDVELKKYADSSAKDDEQKVSSARTKLLGATKDDVLDAIFNLRQVRGEISQKLALQAYDKAVEHSDWYGDPRSVWGFTGGLTEVARDLPNTDDRVKLDRAAGKILQTAF